MSQFPPPAVAPPPPPSHAGVPSPPSVGEAEVESSSISPWAVALLALGVSVVCWVIWFALDDVLAEVEYDAASVWVPTVTLGVAGLAWAAASPGPSRPVRIGSAGLIGAAVGALGAFLAGRAEPHLEAANDGAIDIGQIAAWAALGAAAWAITLGVASSSDRRRATMIGAALGGAASGGVMGALLGHFRQGDPPRVVPTDFWWSLPLRTAEVGVWVVPVLVVGVVVPMVCAHPARTSVVVGRAAAALVVLVAAGVVLVQNDVNSAAVTPELSTDGTPTSPDSSTETATPEAAPPETPPGEAASSATAAPAITATPPTAAPVDTPAPAATTPDPPAQTLPFPVETGFDISVVYNGTAANESGETAVVDIAIGDPFVATSAFPISTGELVCPLGPSDAVFPFAVALSASGLELTTSVRISFGQGGVDGADTVTHPLSVQWNYAGGRECLPATAVSTDPAAAGSTWATLRANEPQYGFGYLVVGNYFDPSGQAVGASSAGTGVGVVIGEQRTNSEWRLTGGAVGTVHDPTFGDYGAVLFG